MKRAFICILLLMPAILAWCQPMWPEEAIVRDGQDLHHYEAPVCDSSGNVLNSWVKTTGNKHLIYAALSLADGTALWDDPLLIKTCDTPANDINLLATSDNCFIISWLEVASFEGNYIHLHKIDSTGLLLWERRISAAVERVVVTYHYQVAANNIGGAYVFFHEINRNQLYGRCLNSAGDEIWGDDAPHITVAGRLYLNGIASSGDYGVAVHYSSTSDTSNYVERYSDSGVLTWQQTYPDESGRHYFFLTADHTILDVTNTDEVMLRLKIRAFDSLGTNLIDPPYELTLTGQGACPLDYDVCLDGQNLNVVFNRPTGDLNEIRYYQVNSLENQAYPAGGLLLGTHIGPVRDLKICVDNAMNAYCSWIEAGGGSSALKANMVSSDLQPAWGTDGIILYSDARNIGHHGIAVSNATLTAVYDVDDITSMKLNKQVVYPNGTPVYIDGGQTIASSLLGNATQVATHRMGDRVLLLYRDVNSACDTALLYQIIDADGSPILPEPVQMGSYSTGRNIIGSCEMDNNRVALAYYDDGVFLQIINYEGDQDLAQPGLPIYDSLVDGFALSFYDGDLYFGWMEDIGPGYKRLMGQRYSGGQKLWGESGKILVDDIAATPSNTYITASKGPYFTWTKQGIETTITSTQCLLVDLAGDPSPGWNAMGETIFSSSSDPGNRYTRPFYAQLDGSDLILVLGGYIPSSIYAVKVTDQHELPWGTTGLLLAENSVASIKCTPKADGLGILMDNRVSNSALSSVVIYQSVDFSGNLQHEFPGLPLYATSDRETVASLSLAAYANGGMLAIWGTKEDMNYTDNCSLFYRTLNPLGGFVEGGAQPVCDLNRSDGYALSVALDNEAMVVWDLWRYYVAEGYDNPFRGVLAQKINGMIASNPQGPEEIESPLVISSAYPNPFSDTVTLAWIQKSVEPVQISVYNLKGQLVQRLPSVPQGKGEHSLNWDGKDSQGKRAGAGIYFLRVQSGRAIQAKKIVKLK